MLTQGTTADLFLCGCHAPTVGLRQQEKRSFIRIDNEILGLTGIERNNYCQQATVMHTGYNL